MWCLSGAAGRLKQACHPGKAWSANKGREKTQVLAQAGEERGCRNEKRKNNGVLGLHDRKRRVGMILQSAWKTFYVRKIPKGCAHCVSGRKMVVFIGGRCNCACWYCPIPLSRRTDTIWANEEKTGGIVAACRKAGANGASITGGEPLLYLGNVVETARALKEEFGKKFHVHTYTNGLLATKEKMQKLAEAGIDELRIHPVGDWKCIGAAVGTIHSVGIEVPVIPGGDLTGLIDYSNKEGVDFLSLVEMEFSTANREELLKRGFARKGKSWAVNGSREEALKYLQHIETNTGMHAHHCTIEGREQMQIENRKNAKRDS